MAAPPELVHGLVNDFRQWARWSPWEQRDPNLKRSFEGPRSGVGAVYGWTGNDQVGQGRMTITESTPGERVGIKLEFLKPFAATNVTEFGFAPAGAGRTQVTWAMSGKNDLLGKLFSVFMNMDAMVGKDFEEGLARMRAESEDAARKLTAHAAPSAP